MLVLVVREELDRHFLGQHEVAPDVWVWGSYVSTDQHLDLNVSKCPGGAYSHFGRVLVGEVETVFWVKTIWGIMAHRSELVQHHFEYCDPAFPANLIGLVKRAAANANRCFALAHRRGWNHHLRRVSR